MKTKKFGLFLFVVAIGFAFIASYLAVQTVQSYKNVGYVIKVVKDIPPYSKIEEQDIQKAEVPMAAISESAETDPQQVIGKYSNTFIPSGAILDKNTIATVQSQNGGVAVPLSDKKSKDIRAMGLPEDYVQVLGEQVKDQDHVDLIGIFNHEDQSFAKTIAQGVEILRRNPKDQGGGIIVAVTTKQAEEISLAMSFGKLVVAVTPYQFENKSLKGTYLESLFLSGMDEKGGKK